MVGEVKLTWLIGKFSSIQFSSFQLLSHVWLFATPWTAARQASLSFTNSQSLLKLMSIESVMPCNHFILCHPLLFLPSVFPSIGVFSNELAVSIRRPKYWSFSSPSSDYSGLISFRIDWFDPKHEVKWNVSHSVVPNSLIQSISVLMKLFRSLFLQEAFPDYLKIHYFVCSLIFVS